MAELDYAFLCDYASVSDGKLTAVGASYTEVKVPGLPAMHSLGIAARVRATLEEDSVPFIITVKAPREQYVINIEAALTRDQNARQYADKVGMLFGATALIALPSSGLYEVDLTLGGEVVRRLFFECSVIASAES